jgi:hypothetical protein
MRLRELAELAGEALLAGIVEHKIVEDERLVLVQGLTNLGDCAGIELGSDVDAAYRSSDPSGDLADLE